VLSDTLVVPEGLGHVSGVSVREVEGGVEATVSVSDAVRVYSAVYRRGPSRIEVEAEAAGGSGISSPPLLEPRSLLPDSDEMFGGTGGGIQTVMLDPGGGGHEAGSVGRAGLTSKEVNLALAREIGEYLQDQGYYVFMTRHGDTHLTLKRRAEIANLAGANVFVSVQCGAHMSGAVGGFRVLYYEPRPDVVRGRRGAERGGLVRRHRGREPSPADALLWESVQSEYVQESRGLARAVHRRLDAAIDRPDRGVRRANLLVLGGCAMPAVQIEAGFITNGTDESLLSDRDYLRAVARSIALGIMDFTRGND
jgi:N-acetylmuramoyl-L-alanine amidase